MQIRDGDEYEDMEANYETYITMDAAENKDLALTTESTDLNEQDNSVNPRVHHDAQTRVGSNPVIDFLVASNKTGTNKDVFKGPNGNMTSAQTVLGNRTNEIYYPKDSIAAGNVTTPNTPIAIHLSKVEPSRARFLYENITRDFDIKRQGEINKTTEYYPPMAIKRLSDEWQTPRSNLTASKDISIQSDYSNAEEATNKENTQVGGDLQNADTNVRLSDFDNEINTESVKLLDDSTENQVMHTIEPLDYSTRVSHSKPNLAKLNTSEHQTPIIGDPTKLYKLDNSSHVTNDTSIVTNTVATSTVEFYYYAQTEDMISVEKTTEYPPDNYSDLIGVKESTISPNISFENDTLVQRKHNIISSDILEASGSENAKITQMNTNSDLFDQTKTSLKAFTAAYPEDSAPAAMPLMSEIEDITIRYTTLVNDYDSPEHFVQIGDTSTKSSYLSLIHI